MDRRRTPVMALVFFILVVVAILAWRFGPETRDAQGTTESGAVDAPSAGDEEPAAGIVRQPDAPTVDPETVELTQTRAQQDEQSRRISEAGKSKLLGQYQSEAVDQRWASSKQQALEALQSSSQIEALNARPVAFDVACRSSTCRIQADFASRMAADDWATLYILNAGPEMSNSHFQRTDYPDGTASVELYGQAR